jgi:flagellar motility protein MotE (MotC chaperone)
MCYAGTLRTLPASRFMRILTAVSILALAFASQAAQAQAPVARDTAPQAPAEKAFSHEESAARIDAIRQKAEALERSRDEKLKRTTKSICIGC